MTCIYLPFIFLARFSHRVFFAKRGLDAAYPQKKKKKGREGKGREVKGGGKREKAPPFFLHQGFSFCQLCDKPNWRAPRRRFSRIWL